MIWNDMFAGGGGTSHGLHNVKGVQVAAALNHWKNAVNTHKINFRDTKHFWADVYDTDEHILPKCDGFWASIDCTDHSNAKGGQPKNAGSYMLADELPRFIKYSNPAYIVIENVREFLKWGPLKNGKRTKATEGQYYLRWVEKIKALGYPNYEYSLLNVADYGERTSRTRLIIVFSKTGYDITWPQPTHNKNGTDGLKRWNGCREKIDLSNEGHSIFGRKYNTKLAKHVRREVSPNTKRRIVGGIFKYHPEFAQFLMSYYSSGQNVTSLEEPCPVITTKDRHALVTLQVEKEKMQFVTDYIWGVQLQHLDDPMKVITTRESKHFITLYYGRDDAISDLEDPLQVIPTENRHALTTLKKEIEQEKKQFISNFFSGNGNPEAQNSSLEDPLGALTTINKRALATLSQNGTFDIKMRFLDHKELAAITGFPDEHKWFGSKKDIIRMIGNAVPPKLSEIVATECKKNFDKYKLKKYENKIGNISTK